MSNQTIDTAVVEVHGSDTSALTYAKNHVKKTVPGLVEVLDASYGVGRCEHGNLLVQVTYVFEEDTPDVH